MYINHQNISELKIMLHCYHKIREKNDKTTACPQGKVE